MSVTVKHLNADTSFLLTFSPRPNSPTTEVAATDGAFSLLIDPWLDGPSIVTAPWFAKTEHKIPSAVQHLSELPALDVVIVSQNKPDHCHKATLLQLPADGKTIIAAEPGAAKAIKSWNHFDPAKVRGLRKYDAKVKSGGSLRLSIPALSPDGFSGEVSISFIPAKHYMTGLHNAIGVTYRPPTCTKSIAPMATVDLPKTTRYFHVPLSPMTVPPSSPQPPVTPLANRPMSFDQPARSDEVLQSVGPSSFRGHRPRLSRSSNTASSEFLPSTDKPVIRVSAESERDEGTIVHNLVTVPDRSPRINSAFDFKFGPSPFTYINSPPTPPDSPAWESLSSHPDPTSNSTSSSPTSPLFHQRCTSSVPSHQRSLSSVSSMPNLITPLTPARPQAVSIIYSPHGLPLADLQPYIENHLVRLPGALPLTLLLHSFDYAQNPWYLGGNIMTGMYGGAEIAQAVMARCWISAHDEPKDDSGLSVKKLRLKRIGVDEVRKHLRKGEHGEWLRQKGWTCDVRQLGVGKEICIGPLRDSCSSIKGRKDSAPLRLRRPSELQL
ncbi:hypothetical protein A1O7_09722 [Cladophialophora yegresii CBS 114405]|uniref:Metallo-beta-lactamase domain-containing protein n=1 Tax=Cladophialophora yegresii CBS 114405 TaxID=1182544 RepID=W9VFZ7_9EURO|nr:uncharacterized protein A1O7_09722 [Cladophialophora yegresii CBS 114405]EXJ54383.1 hypothetical protein A1O7_09722 [Cladophialophora yegresii CBS 114405]